MDVLVDICKHWQCTSGLGQNLDKAVSEMSVIKKALHGNREEVNTGNLGFEKLL